MIIVKKIKNQTELLAVVSAQKVEVKPNFTEFVMIRSSQAVEECTSTAWETETASKVLQGSKLTRFEILQKCLHDPSQAGRV